MTRTLPALALALLATGAAALLVAAPEVVERAMYGGSNARNMISDETGLPGDWDIKTGNNVKWWADVGSQAYAGPVLLESRVRWVGVPRRTGVRAAESFTG